MAATASTRQSRLFLHVGLPRTATTALQKSFFPTQTDIVFLGKPSDNNIHEDLKGPTNPIKVIRDNASRFGQDQAATDTARSVLPLVIKHLKVANQFNRIEQAKKAAQLLNACIAEFRQQMPAQTLLYSDESLIESVAGLSSNSEHGCHVPLEQMAAYGGLKDLAVILVLRDPIEFLRASWYKNNEFQYRYKLGPYSFDTWIRKQLAVFVRHPSASRIFQAMQKSFVRHVKTYCPVVHVCHYESLKTTNDLLADLTGGEFKSPGVNLGSLPMENNSLRDADVVDFMLSAEGVPRGMTIDEYQGTFGKTLSHYEIGQWLIAQSVRIRL